jgi:nickel transport protein
MRFSLLAAVLLLSATSPAFAHRLHVEPKVVGDQLRVEAYYEDDTPAQDAKVTVRSGDATVAEGRTNEKGVWTCAKPAAGTYTVRAESVGHAATETIVIAKAEDGPPTATIASDDSGSVGRKAKTRTPWRNLILGVGLVAAACLAWLVSRKTGRPPAP